MLSGPCRKDVRSILGNLYLVQVLRQVFLGHAVQTYKHSGGTWYTLWIQLLDLVLKQLSFGIDCNEVILKLCTSQTGCIFY